MLILLTVYAIFTTDSITAQVLLAATECTSETPAIANGYVISTGPYYNGSRAAYTCQTGYAVSGIANDVICWDNDWYGTAPVCDKITNTTADHDHLYVIIAFGILVGVIFVIFITLACIYICVRHRNNKLYHLRPLSDGGFKRHVYHNEYLYHREDTKIETLVNAAGTQTLPGRVDAGTGSAKIYYTRSSGTHMEHNMNDAGTQMDNIKHSIAVNTDPPVTVAEVQASPIPALSIISSLDDFYQKPKAPVKPMPPPPPPIKTVKPASQQPMWMPHRNPVRNINTSTR